jgi:hypothetical protein
MNRFIQGGKGDINVARSLQPGDKWFWPFFKPSQVSPFVARYNRKGMSLKTKMEVIEGIWGTTIRRRDEQRGV